MDLALDPAKTALVVIDLQKGMVERPGAPHAGPDVVARTARIAAALKAKGGFVVLVHVTTLGDGLDRPHPTADAPLAGAGRPQPPDYADIDPLLLPFASIVITKRQWGAFYGTELDLQLRRRSIDTIVLCGIATTMGVESTARDAYELGYNQVFVEDAMATFSAEAHELTVKYVFPMIGRVRSTEDVLAAIG